MGSARSAQAAPVGASFTSQESFGSPAAFDEAAGPALSLRFRCRLLGQCFAAGGRHVEVHPEAARFADSTRQQAGRGASQFRSYGTLARHAGSKLPKASRDQIYIDVERTFAALPNSMPERHWCWPEDVPLEERKERLRHVLEALEFRHQLMRESSRQARKVPDAKRETGITYVQGCSLMAAMCMGFLGGHEEDGYWLYAYLVDHVIGRRYFEPFPPLADYHGDRAAVAALVGSICPRLTGALGHRQLAALVSMLASRCFLSGFVGFLSGEPLLAMWEELLACRVDKAAIPRLTMHKWLAGIIRALEEKLLSVIHGGTPALEAVPLLFQMVQEEAQTLPSGWRPGVKVFPHQLTCLQDAFHTARAGFVERFETQMMHERHAEDMAGALHRTTSKMEEVMKCFPDVEVA